MKVLYLSTTIAISETFIYNLSKGLSKHSKLTHIIGDEPYYKTGINYKIVDFDVSSILSTYLSYIFESRGKKLLYKLRQLKGTKKLFKYIVKTDVVYIDYGTNAARFLPTLIKINKPFVVHFHGFDITSELKDLSYKNELKKVFNHASYIIAASYHIKRLLVLNGCEDSKVKVVRLGLEFKGSKTDLAWEQKDIDFIFVGRLTPKKCPSALIHAFFNCLNELPNRNLHIIGEGPLFKESKDLCKELDIENKVVFHGALCNDEVINLMKRAKIFVQHSVTPISGDQEGFAISIAEAALYKLPVIATLHNGIPENVINNETGFLVKEYDYEAMGEKMAYLIKNEVIALRMGEKGQEHIKEMCSNKRRVEEILDLLARAVNEKVNSNG